jgi:chromate transporter
MESRALMAAGEIVALFLHFLILSFIAVGGAPTVLPEMHRYVVEVHAWMSSTQFAELYALAQVAPGPNVMYIPLIGWHVARWTGVAATTIPFILPSATLALLVAHLHTRNPTAAFGVAIRKGLTPITIGLIFASGWILMPAVNHDWRGYALTALTVVIVMRSRLNPIWLLAVGAAAGIGGFV